MRILHVSLGDPAQHRGGLNRYCRELMNEQRQNGNKVMLLFAGNLSFSRRPRIVEISQEKYALQNSLPVAITYGIDDPKRYMRKSDISIFRDWLQGIQPDIIHVHSIQGVYLEFFQAANALGIPMCYTTHDYYPICFRCTLLQNTGKLCDGRDPLQCAKCNYKAGLSGAKQALLQSELYQNLKNNKLVFLLRKNVTAQVAMDTAPSDTIPEPTPDQINDFEALGKYYDKILDCFTIIHANSPRTCEVYKSFRPDLKYRTISITRAGLKQSVHQRRENAPIRFGYMGGMSVHKGYHMFQKALMLLDEAGYTNWEAWYYGGDYVPTEQESADKRRYYCGVFGAAQEAEVWENIDALVVPCVCAETFGLVVLEALCHGVPVICSDLAGSKYLVEELQKKLVVPNDQPAAYKKAMAWLMDGSNYNSVKTHIDSTWLPIDFGTHCKEIYSMYEKCGIR